MLSSGVAKESRSSYEATDVSGVVVTVFVPRADRICVVPGADAKFIGLRERGGDCRVDVSASTNVTSDLI